MRACLREYCVYGLWDRAGAGGERRGGEGLKAREEGCMERRGLQGRRKDGRVLPVRFAVMPNSVASLC